MTLQDPKQAYSVRFVHALGRLRMRLELKRDGRIRDRLIINKELVGWQTDSNASSVAYLESIRTMLFMYGCLGDCLSINDISVAFLQADDFPEDDKRYVSYTAYKGAVEHVLRLHGCLYGQKCASKQFYCTLACPRTIIQSSATNINFECRTSSSSCMDCACKLVRSMKPVCCLEKDTYRKGPTTKDCTSASS